MITMNTGGTIAAIGHLLVESLSIQLSLSAYSHPILSDDGCAANALTTVDFPPFALWAGHPAVEVLHPLDGNASPERREPEASPRS
jgi:hypothetical protein